MGLVSFNHTLKNNRINLQRGRSTTLQINLGKLCNQSCSHCHVEAGPLRTENMDRKTVDRIFSLLRNSPTIETVDLTGGAPELNPHFIDLIKFCRNLGLQVIDRCNLTVLTEPGQENTAQFFKENGVRVIASLPCYSKENVEKQRGKGVFDKSIKALKLLNSLGYGNGSLQLDLVYNPSGPFLPPSQKKLEEAYHLELRELFGIEFNQLFTITNMPIKRFLDDLISQEKYEDYMNLLVNSFNLKNLDHLMCRSLISIGWDGKIYDCDFNQMVEMPLLKSIWEISSFEELISEKIQFANHCYGCSAGEGSSCNGALI